MRHPQRTLDIPIQEVYIRTITEVKLKQEGNLQAINSRANFNPYVYKLKVQSKIKKI